MPLIPVSDESIKQAAQALSCGGLVSFPTETVYGLGGDAFNPIALARIFEAKGRPRFDPLIVHIAAVDALDAVADLALLDTAAREKATALTGQLWPGPLTLILPKQNRIPDLATSDLPTVAVRLPAHDTARRLIGLSTGAVAAPSANPFGYLSPTTAEHVFAMLGDKIEIILDGGPSRLGVESTVLDLCHGQPRILRPGGTPREAIEALIGPVAGNSATVEESPVSPGMLKSHYAPRTQLIAHNAEDLRCLAPDNTASCVFFDGASRDAWLSGHTAAPQFKTIAVLSETGVILEAAARLFSVLHELDNPETLRIHVQFAPEEGLGAAINDRLRKAAGT